MSIFRAVGWLLGVPPAEQRQHSKMLKEDERKNIQKLKENAQLRIKKENKFEDLDLKYYISNLINSFPITYSFSEDTRLSINSNSYKMFEIIVFKYIDDLLKDLNTKFNPTYLNIDGKTIHISQCSSEEKKRFDFKINEMKLKNLENIKYKHIEIWNKKKTVEELQEVYETAVLKEKNSEINKIEMLEKEKKILELEKEIRELKENNRERNR